jgi:hypothetical protein
MQIRVFAFFLLCCAPTWALESSYTAPEFPPQTASTTTLPAAQPSGNNANPCDFTDRWSMIDRVLSDWQGYNISLLVSTCPNVCVLIYGDGNPDVSGIGVSRVLTCYPSLTMEGIDILRRTVHLDRLGWTGNFVPSDLQAAIQRWIQPAALHDHQGHRAPY